MLILNVRSKINRDFAIKILKRLSKDEKVGKMERKNP